MSQVQSSHYVIHDWKNNTAPRNLILEACSTKIFTHENNLLYIRYFLMHRHTSLVPRPLLPPVFDHFQYINMVLGGLGDLIMCHAMSGTQRVDIWGGSGQQNISKTIFVMSLQGSVAGTFTKQHQYSLLFIILGSDRHHFKTGGHRPSCAYPLYLTRHNITTHNNISHTFSLLLDSWRHVPKACE